MRKSHFIITVLLFGLIVCGPFVPDYAVHLLFLSATFVTALLLSADTSWIRRLVMVLGGIVLIGMVGLEYVARHGMGELLKASLVAELVTVFLFLVYCAAISLVLLLRIQLVSANEIFATVNLYLVLGIAWAYGYMLLEIASPGAFVLTDATRGIGVQMLYFSFVTLTTLGYGDIVAASEIARMLVVTEAIVGNLYVAVVVTYLLSVHIDQGMKAKGNG